MNPLAPFSDWTLALVPRLFLYPGGVWLLGVLLLLRVAVRLADRGDRAHGLLDPFLRCPLAPLALAWAAVSLLDMPSANSLPFGADRLSLAALLAFASLVDARCSFSEAEAAPKEQILAEGALVLAALAPLAAGRTLFVSGTTGAVGWLSLAAVVVGLVALYPAAAGSLSISARWVGWLGLGAAPLWTLFGQGAVPGVLVATLVTAAVTGLAVVSRGLASGGVVTPLAWGLSALSLLAALVRL